MTPSRLLLCVLFLPVCSASWIDDDTLRAKTSQKKGVAPLKIEVDLDKAPSERWAHLAENPVFSNYKQDLTNYLLPIFKSKLLLPLIAALGRGLESTFSKDYAAEMRGLASALKVNVGDIVVVNLIYQLEKLGVSCDKRNTTGPCPQGDTKDSPGLCTGILADDGEKVLQGRNLDWDLPDDLLKYVMQVEYKQSNQTRFVGVQVAGMVGVLHGLSLSSGFSVQINARKMGGDVLTNFRNLLHGVQTPSHVLRRSFEGNSSFDGAVKYLSNERLANPVYYVVAGASHRQGVVLSRERDSLLDAWNLYEESAKDKQKINKQPSWLRLQTNYDHWTAVPSYDDRRTPGLKHTSEFCSGDVNEACMWKSMTTWPVMNYHTDVTSVMCPATGYIATQVWMDIKDTTIIV